MKESKYWYPTQLAIRDWDEFLKGNYVESRTAAGSESIPMNRLWVICMLREVTGFGYETIIAGIDVYLAK